jgi:hypothetical protein
MSNTTLPAQDPKPATGKPAKAAAPLGFGPSDKAFTVPHTAASIAATLGGNVFQPLLPIAWLSVPAFAGVLGFAIWRKRAGKPIAGLLGFAVMGFLISAFLLAGQFLPKTAEQRQLAAEVGAVAANVPGLVAMQNAVLPISEREKQTNSFRRAIITGDEDDRGLAARTRLDQASEAPVRNALQAIALKSDAAPVRQAGLAQALFDRSQAWLPVTIVGEPEAPQLRAIVQGAQFQLNKVNLDSGVVDGVMQCADGARRTADGMIASGRLTLSASCYSRELGGWRIVQIDVAPNDALRLVGTAKIEAETAEISLPLI